MLLLLLICFPGAPGSYGADRGSIKKSGAVVDKQWKHLKEHFPFSSLKLTKKSLNATAWGAQWANIREECYYVSVDFGIKVHLTKVGDLAKWKDIKISDNWDEFRVNRIEFSYVEGIGFLGPLPKGLDPRASPDDVKKAFGRPEGEEISDGKKRLYYRLSSLIGGPPFEFIFEDEMLQSIAVVGSCDDSEWNAYFLNG